MRAPLGQLLSLDEDELGLDDGNAFPSGVGLEPHVTGVEIGPPGLVGPQFDAGVDADGVEASGGVLATESESWRSAVMQAIPTLEPGWV